MADDTPKLERLNAALAKILPTPSEGTSGGIQALIRQEKIDNPYENPMLYYLLKTLCSEIEEAAAALSKPVTRKLIIGTLPSGRVNARAICLPQEDEYVIIIERELFMFAYKLSKIFVRTMSFDGKEGHVFRFSFNPKKRKEFQDRIRSDVVFLARFLDVVVAYVLKGRVSLAEHHFPDEHSIALASIITFAMELFVIGHEYAHILEGHFAKRSTAKFTIGSETVDEILPDWEQEFDADAHGLELMLVAMAMKHKHSVVLSFWGADFFFTCLDVMDRALATLITGDDEVGPSASHPTAATRRKVLRRVLLRSSRKPGGKAAVEMATALEWAGAAFWEKAKPFFQKLHQQGVRPHASWLH